MNVLMVSMIIPMTQTMQDQSNKYIWPPFQSNDCTHDLRWYNYVFVIEPTFEWIKNQHVAIRILNHQLTCHNTFFEFFKF